MRILHPGVFPVGQLNSALIYQEIVTDGVNVGEAVPLLLFVNKRLQREHSLPGFLIILMDTRPSPQALIKLNPVKDIKGVTDLQLHAMEAPQQIHAPSDIVFIIGAAGPGTFDISCNFHTGIFIQIDRIITEAQTGNGPVHIRFLLPVDELIRSFTGNTDDVPRVSGSKEERPVCHALLKSPPFPCFFEQRSRLTGK